MIQETILVQCAMITDQATEVIAMKNTVVDIEMRDYHGLRIMGAGLLHITRPPVIHHLDRNIPNHPDYHEALDGVTHEAQAWVHQIQDIEAEVEVVVEV